MNALTPCSGVAYVAMPWSFSTWIPSRMLSPPSHAARIGFGVVAASSPTARATEVGLVMACGVRITRTASTPGSFKTAATALATRFERASPRTSTGFLRDQAGGRFSSSSARVSGESCARTPREPTSASVAMTPGPPAFVTMPRRGPGGSFPRPIRSAQSKSSPMFITRATPARRNAAS